MPTRYPPISALRAIEAAARLKSYAQAAQELNVTQSAISHQIKHAEEIWGIKLFTQDGRKRVLTPAGKVIVPIVRDFTQRLSASIENLKDEQPSDILRVSLLPSFAMKWLVPRLGRFQQANPHVEISLSTSTERVDFDSDTADIAIRLGYGSWPDTYAEKILSEHVFPVCSPAFIKQNGLPKTPEELLHYPLFRRSGQSISPRWRNWFSHAQVEATAFAGGITFADSALAIQAALDGLGIALARSAHVVDDIEAGRLVHLCPQIEYQSDLSYYFLCSLDKQHDPHVLLFRDWLLQEAQATQKVFNKNAI